MLENAHGGVELRIEKFRVAHGGGGVSGLDQGRQIAGCLEPGAKLGDARAAIARVQGQAWIDARPATRVGNGLIPRQCFTQRVIARLIGREGFKALADRIIAESGLQIGDQVAATAGSGPVRLDGHRIEASRQQVRRQRQIGVGRDLIEIEIGP